MASAVAMTICAAVVNAYSREVTFYFQNWEKHKMLKRKEKGMVKQSNN